MVRSRGLWIDLSCTAMVRGLVAALCICAIASPVMAQSAPQVDPNRRAYGYALRCAATAAGIHTDPHSTAPQKTTASTSYDRAADAAFRMGRVLRLSDEQVRQDLLSTVRTEAALQLRDAAYYARTQGQCAQLGM